MAKDLIISIILILKFHSISFFIISACKYMVLLYLMSSVMGEIDVEEWLRDHVGGRSVDAEEIGHNVKRMPLDASINSIDVKEKTIDANRKNISASILTLIVKGKCVEAEGKIPNVKGKCLFAGTQNFLAQI